MSRVVTLSSRQFAVVLALSASVTVRIEARDDRCERAFSREEWSEVSEHCPLWSPREQLASALSDQTHRIARLEALLDTEVGTDAAFFAGYHLGRMTGDEESTTRGRELLRRAVDEFQRGGLHARASRAARHLSRASRDAALLDDAVAFAELAVKEAEIERDAAGIGSAQTALAEAYSAIGMTTQAREAFVRAEDPDRPPAELANTYLSHGIFLVDQESDDQRRVGLGYLRLARNTSTRPDIVFSARLNAANAYADLGDRAAAEAELDMEPRNDDERRTILLTRGFLAARADELEEAERFFLEADVARYGADTAWWTALELARAYRRAGRLPETEQFLRAAIDIAERLRGSSSLQLRPFLLSRRASAYTELVSLLTEQNRGLAAAVIAESLHARTWLDAVVGSKAERTLSTDQIQREAALRRRYPAQPALDEDALLALLGDREALVILQAGAASWRVHIDRQRAEVTPISAADLDAILTFRDHPDDSAAAERAAHALLPRTLVDRTDPLIIVASGALADVPFAALPLGDAKLVHRRAVVRVPGLAALGCRSRAVPWSSAQRFLGDATNDLPSAAAEVRRLAGADARTGRLASSAAILDAGNFELLHVAVHGKATGTGGALLLADGLLTTTDILANSIGPRVVMLTGCTTAASADAEAWSGFPSAFLANGSEFVVATLRSVDDTAASAMVNAYNQQPATLSPPERLAAAQRAVASKLDVQEWGAFAAWGDPACWR